MKNCIQLINFIYQYPGNKNYEILKHAKTDQFYGKNLNFGGHLGKMPIFLIIHAF